MTTNERVIKLETQVNEHLIPTLNAVNSDVKDIKEMLTKHIASENAFLTNEKHEVFMAQERKDNHERFASKWVQTAVFLIYSGIIITIFIAILKNFINYA